MVSKLSQVLLFLIKEANINASILSRHTGIPTSTLNRLLQDSDVNPTVQTLKPIAEYFRVTLGQLVGEEPLDSRYLSSNGTISMLPVIAWKNITAWFNHDFSVLNDNFISSEKKFPKNSFAVLIESDEFDLFVKNGSLVIISPIDMVNISYGAMILVNIGGIISLKQFLKHDGKCYVRSLNKTLMTNKEVDEKVLILGLINEIRIEITEQKNSYSVKKYEKTDIVFNPSVKNA